MVDPDLETGSPGTPFKPRSRVYSNDSTNSVFVSSPTHSPSPKRSAILPEGDASPIGSVEDGDHPPPAAGAGVIPSPQRSSSVDQSMVLDRSVAYEAFFHRRLLIVDDAPSNRKVVNRLLRDKISHRDEACNGLEAVQKVSQTIAMDTPYDCIILDYYMPELDGPGAAQQMRALGFQGVIVGVTGNNDTTDINKFKAAGANHVLVKPLDADLFWTILTGNARALTSFLLFAEICPEWWHNCCGGCSCVACTEISNTSVIIR